MKGSKIWGVGKHHLFVDGEPTWVYVSEDAVKKDYNILKARLPIPIGIDHLDKKIIQENKILEKFDLLNVGSIEDVELKEDGIHILDYKISNPIIQELYAQKKLPSLSMVGNVNLSECASGKVDYVENYNVINRVDFVEKGACTTCNVEYAENNLMNAKSVIGDIMAEDGNNGNNNNEGQEGGNQDPTLADVAKSITNFKQEINDKLDDMDERIKAIEGGTGEAGDAGDEGNGENSGDSGDSEENPELKAMQAEIAELKAKSAKKEATSLVNGYIDEGKVLPKAVAKHVSLALAEPEAYKEMMAEAPVVVEIDKRISNAEAGNAGDGEPEEYTDEKFAEDYEAAFGEKPE